MPRPGQATELHERYGLVTKYLDLSPAQARSLRGTQQLWRKMLASPAALAVMSRAYGILRSVQPDIVHVNDDQAILLWGPLAHAFGIPVVWHVRRVTGSCLDVIRVRLADAAVYTSQATTGRVHHYRNPPKVEAVIYNGFDFSELRPLKRAERAKIRAEIGVPDSSPLVGFVASLTEIKRPEDFVAAGLQILHDVPLAHFAIVGGDYSRDRYTEELTRRVEAAGAKKRFHFLGYRADASKILGAFDVFVLTSEEEGFGRVVVEAMARGVPVVASDVGGVAEIINAPGLNGLLVPPGDVGGFSQAVVHLLQKPHLRRSMSQEARRSVQSRFDIALIVRQMQAGVYDRLLEQPGTR